MPRLTAEQWSLARAKWEADPIVTFEELGKEFGVSKQAVQKRAKDGGWVRRADNLAQMAARAHAKADASIDRQVDRGVDLKRPEAEDARVAARAAVLERHRTEMNASRKKVYEALTSGDFEKAKLAKITAEALQIIQASERKAWALDAGEQPGAPGNNTVVVIERVAAPAGRVIDSPT